ncbi:MAG: hypothetical protein WA240_09260 [Nitrospirota bacterium]
MKNIISSFMLILVFTLFATPAFAAGPWRGKIIDIETKEPLEGAVVLAVWERVYRTPTGDSSYFYEAKEVLTDKEGRFEIPSYTPINFVPLLSYMRGPHFTIFKPGYLSIEWWHGEYFLEGSTEKTVKFEKYEKKYILAPGIIELPPLKTREERLRNMPAVSVPYKKQRLLIKLINEERKNLGLEGELKIE